MHMRFYFNGELKATKRVANADRMDDVYTGKGICYFGNSQHLGNGVNADVGYLVVSDVARQSANGFKNEVFHRYPIPRVTPMIMYFKLDSVEHYDQDYYYNATIKDFEVSGLEYVKDENKTSICKCYSKPVNVYTMKRGRVGMGSLPI